jgi:hypothetical protein
VSRLPERIEGEGVLLRRWVVADAEAQHRAVAESAEHLRPWMAWMASKPQPLEQRRTMIARRARNVGRSDVVLGVLAHAGGGAATSRQPGRCLDGARYPGAAGCRS